MRADWLSLSVLALLWSCGASQAPPAATPSDGFHERVLRGCATEKECRQLAGEAMVRAIHCAEAADAAINPCQRDAVRVNLLYAEKIEERERSERAQRERERERERDTEASQITPAPVPT